MEITLLECKHCNESGTCQIDNGNSCGTCLKEAKSVKGSKIVACGVCAGVGKVEPKTSRLNSRLPFLIVALVLLVFYFYTFVNLGDDSKFDKIFPLIASLTTMIVTFYFTKK
ncbi:hypothetical protein ACE02P_08440 [Shewanella bicestrii]